MANYKLSMAAAAIFCATVAPGFAAPAAADRDFAQKAAAGGLAEVALGQLAQQNGSAPQVKEFGQRMVTDHGQANEELQRIAQSLNLTLPTEPAAKEQATLKRLSALKGAAFDTAYTQDMVRDHQEDVIAFQREAQSGKDPALKAFAQKHLPVLQQHLQMAQAAKSGK
jgi:putative membrane protein